LLRDVVWVGVGEFETLPRVISHSESA